MYRGCFAILPLFALLLVPGCAYRNPPGQGGYIEQRYWEPVGHREYVTRERFDLQVTDNPRIVVTDRHVAEACADWLPVWGPGWSGYLHVPERIEGDKAYWFVHHYHREQRR